ncbi:MAG: ankyrin repeat domain-containing protein [Leptospiraceae bacterium]|nr:ankyrin repeat domain-containing protein [Leptospiraceae bacterium]
MRNAKALNILLVFLLFSGAIFAANDPLFEAIDSGDLAEVKRLVEGGADVNSVNVDGYRSAPLAWACANGAFEIGHYLLEKGADPNGSTTYDTALWWCAYQLNKGYSEEKTVRLSRAILEAGGDVDYLKEPTNNGTALMAAAGNNSRLLVDLLLEYGADRNLKDDNGKTAADWAEQSGHIEMANYLRGESNDEYRRSLIYAVRQNDLNRVKQLVEAADGVARLMLVNKQEEQSQRTALHYTAMEGYYEMAVYLIENGADINRPSLGNFTPLITAAAYGKDRIARLLIDRGAKLDAVQSSGCASGYTALLWALEYSNADLAGYMLDKGADPYASYNPIWVAIGNHQMVRTLVDRFQIRPDERVFNYLRRIESERPEDYDQYPDYYRQLSETHAYLKQKFPQLAAMRSRGPANNPFENNDELQATFEPIDIRRQNRDN